jgi:hypothetical protein
LNHYAPLIFGKGGAIQQGLAPGAAGEIPAGDFTTSKTERMREHETTTERSVPFSLTVPFLQFVLGVRLFYKRSRTRTGPDRVCACRRYLRYIKQAHWREDIHGDDSSHGSVEEKRGIFQIPVVPDIVRFGQTTTTTRSIGRGNPKCMVLGKHCLRRFGRHAHCRPGNRCDVDLWAGNGARQLWRPEQVHTEHLVAASSRPWFPDPRKQVVVCTRTTRLRVYRGRPRISGCYEKKISVQRTSHHGWFSAFTLSTEFGF